jgi:protein SCO1/2
MYNIASALEKVSPDVVEQIKVVFVTTDPTRDSAKVVRSWLDNFDHRFIGLTGSEPAIAAAARAAAIFPATKTISDNGNYEVAHAVFLPTPKTTSPIWFILAGRLRTTGSTTCPF